MCALHTISTAVEGCLTLTGDPPKPDMCPAGHILDTSQHRSTNLATTSRTSQPTIPPSKDTCPSCVSAPLQKISEHICTLPGNVCERQSITHICSFCDCGIWCSSVWSSWCSGRGGLVAVAVVGSVFAVAMPVAIVVTVIVRSWLSQCVWSEYEL